VLAANVKAGVGLREFSQGEVYIAKGRVPPPLRPSPRLAVRRGRSPIAPVAGVTSDTHPQTGWCRASRSRHRDRRAHASTRRPARAALASNADEWQYYISGRARSCSLIARPRPHQEFDTGDAATCWWLRHYENAGSEDLELDRATTAPTIDLVA
jgi:hypothetical protein